MSDAIDRQIDRLAGRRVGYAFAVLVTAVAVLIRWALDSLLQDTSQYLMFYFSVMVAALVAGTGPAIVAILLSAVIGTGYFVLWGHLGSGWTDDLSRMVLFVLFGSLATALARRLHEARDRATKTAEALRRTTEQVRLQAAALEAAPNAISLSKTDPQGTIVWVNPAFTMLTGYRDEEAIGHSHHLLRSGQQDAAFYRHLWETIQRGEVWRGELVNRRKDGTLYHEEMGITPLRDEQGRITHYVAVKQDITARKRAEEELERTQSLLAEGERSAHVGSFEYIVATQAITWSDEECRIYGLEPGTPPPAYEVLLAKHIHPEDAAKMHATFAAALQSGAVFELEHRIVRPDGTVRVVHDRAHPHFDAQGTLLRYVGATLDITERKQAEEALRESEAKFRIVADNARAVIGIVQDKRFVYANPYLAEISGYSIQEILAMEFIELVHPDHRPMIADYARRRQLGDPAVPAHDEFKMVTKAGETRWLDVSPGSIEYNGKPAIVGSAFDITARKRAEEALRASEARFRMAAAVSCTMVFDVDLISGRPLFVGGLRELLSFEPDEVVPTLDWWRGRIHPADLAAYDVGWADAIARAVPYHAEYRVRRKQGDYIVVEDASAMICDAAGCAVRAVGGIRDITDRKRAEEELAAAKQAAEEASRAKDHFLAVLSHELRTPLTPVVTALAMLQDDPRWDGGVRETLEMIRRNVEMEARLIDDLLDMTRIVRSKIELEKKPVPLCEVIRRAVEVCRPDIEARRLHFGVDIGPDAPYLVHADIARLQQVFWNLLRNAVKFTPQGGCVGIRCRLEDHTVIAEVNDSGMGIEPDHLGRIFNAFEQAERSITRQFGGLGLGLAIARAIVELHGGTIEASSDGRNKGATFRVRLPILAGVPAAVAGTEQPPAPAPLPATRPLRILLVEDHGDTAKMMRQLLAMDGHEVTIAGDVATAMEEAGKHPFDLLLSDLGLPDASGTDLIQALRARGYRMPGIALSGYGQEEDIRRSSAAGFAAHLTKPTSPDRLAEAIAAAVTCPLPQA